MMTSNDDDQIDDVAMILRRIDSYLGRTNASDRSLSMRATGSPFTIQGIRRAAKANQDASEPGAKNNSVTLSTVRALAKAMNTTVPYLLGDTDDRLGFNAEALLTDNITEALVLMHDSGVYSRGVDLASDLVRFCSELQHDGIHGDSRAIAARLARFMATNRDRRGRDQ